MAANNKNNTQKTRLQKTAAEEVSQTNTVSETTEPQEKKLSVKDIDINQYITVRNGFQGKLVYKSSRTGELFVWEEFGAEQEIELKELVNAKNSSKKFFENNWFMFEDEWVIDYLGVKQFYRNAVSIEDFDKIFSKSAVEIRNIIPQMSDGQKHSAAYRARTLIAEGVIDSNKAIAALEETLGIELVER